jgi:CheY-like chemotaxis protein
LAVNNRGPRGLFRRALVVDDEGGLQFLVRVILEQADYLVDVARDGLDACGKLDLAEYDAIVCDIVMPNMDGPTLYDHLERAHRREAHRIVFVTGADLDPELTGLINSTGCRLLRKPFSVSELCEAVDALAEVPA